MKEAPTEILKLQYKNKNKVMDNDKDGEADICVEKMENMMALNLSSDSIHHETVTSSAMSSSDPDAELIDKADMALALNKIMEERYLSLESSLITRLRECKSRIKEVQLPDVGDKNIFRYVVCGKPYFKDKDNIPAPCNDDTILMKKLEMYDFSTISSVPGWTVKDKSEFITVLLKLSQNIKVRELNSRIAHIRRQAKLKKIKGAVINKEIAIVRKEIEAVSKQSLRELALPIEDEYDWETIANMLHQRHSPQEYRSLWKLFLHPSIRKNKWTKSEHINLNKIASSHDYQNWAKIAKELNTGRTGYQCFVYFRTNMNNDCVGQKWTKDEEEYLKRVIEFYREGDYIPWGKVAASMENRTKISIYNKYIRIEEQRKGRFLPEEDSVILTCVEEFGTNFRRMKKHLPGRSSIQIRNRYQVLMKTRISTVWTIEEDKKLIQLMANQDDITNYSSVCKYFHGKDRVHLRARYLTLVKWMKRHPNLDIALAPRRAARRLGHGHADKDLGNAITNLTNKIHSQTVNKGSNILTEDSSTQDIEDAIIAQLAAEAAKEKSKTSEPSTVQIENIGYTSTTFTEAQKVNIQKLLVLLRSKIDEHRFMSSKDYKIYKGVENSKKAIALVHVRSYTRKKPTEPSPAEYLDIFGKKRLPCLEYVLPPNFATMTACRMLMTYVNDSKQEIKTYIRVLHKKNSVLKDQLENLMERFNSLFLWPLLISNRNPGDYCTGSSVSMQQRPCDICESFSTTQVCHHVFPVYTQERPSWTQPETMTSRSNFASTSQVIDLTDSVSIDIANKGK